MQVSVDKLRQSCLNVNKIDFKKENKRLKSEIIKNRVLPQWASEVRYIWIKIECTVYMLSTLLITLMSVDELLFFCLPFIFFHFILTWNRSHVSNLVLVNQNWVPPDWRVVQYVFNQRKQRTLQRIFLKS